MAIRGLSTKFMQDLSNPSNGCLYPIFEKIRQDHTLMLAIRKNYVNIYYRGGNILKITERNDRYQPFFQVKYDKHNKLKQPVSDILKPIQTRQEAGNLRERLPILKEIMDHFFYEHKKPEREFQQLVARENNDSTISNESEYFISDIEFADSGLGARFDMLGICWPASQRKDGNNCTPALIEMKYGDNALDGKAGIITHLQDFNAFIQKNNKQDYGNLLTMMEKQFDQLNQLGLLHFNRSRKATTVKFKHNSKPEVIFILANHNPRSNKLKAILQDPIVLTYANSPDFDLKFCVSNFAGYAMHQKNMLSLTELLIRL